MLLEVGSIHYVEQLTDTHLRQALFNEESNALFEVYFAGLYEQVNLAARIGQVEDLVKISPHKYSPYTLMVTDSKEVITTHHLN